MHHRSKQAVQILGVFVTNCLRRNKQDLSFIERSLDSKEKKSLLGGGRYWEGGGKRKRGTIYSGRVKKIGKKDQQDYLGSSVAKQALWKEIGLGRHQKAG